MTGIISTAELLLHDANVPPNKRPLFIRTIFENAKRLHSYLEKGALLCAFKSGNVILRMEQVDLRNALEHAIDEKRAAAEQRGVRLEVTSGTQVWVLGNTKHLRSVCVELLDNAIRFSPEGGVVRIQVAGRHEQFELRVSDQGKGIQTELVERVFEGFAVDDLQHHGVGHGLSLALSRAIVDYHDGTIHVESRPDIETTFVVSLPASQDAIAHEGAPGARPDTVTVGPRPAPDEA